MMEKCAGVVIDWLIRCEVVKETDKELYQYAVYSILLSLSPLLLAAGFGICMGCIRESIMIIIPFVIIRKFSGGYHAEHAWSCLIGSCLLLLLCIVLSFHVKCGREIAFCTAVASISLSCISPIDNKNRLLNQDEKRLYKKITAVFVIIFLLMDGVFFCVICIDILSVYQSALCYRRYYRYPAYLKGWKEVGGNDQIKEKNVVWCRKG